MRRHLLLASVLWLAPPALSGAQETSDVMPKPPAAPAGQRGGGGGFYYPGQPIPPRDPSPGDEREGLAPPRHAGDKKEAPTGLVLYDEDFSQPTITGPVDARPPETYVVKKGDTLWDISNTFFRNAWAWPKLWSYNPSITNPHWIYPGDVLRLAPPGQSTPEPIAAAPSTRPREIGELPPAEALYLRQTGFVEPGELASAGTIVGSKEERIMLATLDEAYVDFKPDKPLELNQRYSIYKPIREVKHPITGEYLGTLVQIFGEADVKSVTKDHIAKMTIVDSTDGIERGYRVGPLKRQLRMVDPKPAAGDVVGAVVATIRPIEMVHAYTVVFLDKSKRDGVEVGNRFEIVRRGDGYEPRLWKGPPPDDKRFPREDVGEILVLELREHLATGLVLRSTKEVRIGDRVEAHKGR